MARQISANGFKYIRKDVHDFVVLSNKRGIKSAIDLTNKVDTPGAERPCILAENLYDDRELVDIKILCNESILRPIYLCKMLWMFWLPLSSQIKRTYLKLPQDLLAKTLGV